MSHALTCVRAGEIRRTTPFGTPGMMTGRGGGQAGRAVTAPVRRPDDTISAAAATVSVATSIIGRRSRPFTCAPEANLATRNLLRSRRIMKLNPLLRERRVHLADVIE